MMVSDVQSALRRGRIDVAMRIRKFPTDMIGSGNYGRIPAKEYPEESLAVVRIRDLILAREIRDNPAVLIKDLSYIGKIFNRAQAANFSDWFLQAFRMGHPSHLLARTVTETLATLQNCIARDDLSSLIACVDFLHDEAVVEMLENYIDLQKGQVQPLETGWAYLVKINGDSGLIVGAGDGTMYDAIHEISADNRKRSSDISLLGAWLVHDPQAAASAISEEFSGQINRRGRLFANIARVTERIEGALMGSENLVLSPWHADDDRAVERLGYLQRVQEREQDEDQSAPAAMAAR